MKENRSFEVKEKITNTFLKTVSAYANYGDGVIQFGVTDEGLVVGIEDVNSACLDIENKINDSISPTPNYEISVDNNTNVITLDVHEGVYKPYYYKAKAYKRNDTATIEVDRMELNHLILEGEHRNFDELPSGNNELQFSVLESKMCELLKIEHISPDILRTIGVLDTNGNYNNAGALLADQNPFYGIDCARFGQTIDIILDREIWDHMSILRQYDNVIALYRKYYQYDEIKGPARKTIETIPAKAFREAIANALVHREWDIRSHIRVAMYEDRIEVYSPGGLPQGITEEEYLRGQVSVLRNPIIGAIFFRLQLIESFGTGIQRINASYSESRVKPIYEFSPNAIKVTLPVIELECDLVGDERVVYECLGKVGKTSSQIAKSARFGKNKTLDVLASLIEKGYITRTGNGRGTKYLII